MDKKRKRVEKEPVSDSKKKKLESNPTTTCDDQLNCTDDELLSQKCNINKNTAGSIITLLEDGNTIPFIVRYRRHEIGKLDAEALRHVKDTYETIVTLKQKVKTVLKTVEKTGNLNSQLKGAILNVQSQEELELLYAPFKPSGKRTLVERAKAFGLEPVTMDLLNNTGVVNLNRFVDKNNKELATIADVEKGVMHIIASVIATDTEMLSYLRNLRSETDFHLESKLAKQSKAKEEKANRSVDKSKYENYFDFKASIRFLKPHQILAINRGETQKVLSVKVIVPKHFFNKFSYFCIGKWGQSQQSPTRAKLIDAAIEDSYQRLVEPHIIRELRAELKQMAHKASYEVFASNLKQLLLTKPVKGKKILGIDPGFVNGCKIALISETGTVLETGILYPHKKSSNNCERDVRTLSTIMQKHNCALIALGNGVACRETEAWLFDLIKKGVFAPLDVTFTIISESGASIYSCSAEAKKEFPDLEPNLISAISLARRVQEPMAELVKVLPKHIGVGMYQHDLPKKQLDEALDAVISECVSFVGVDLNTTSQCLLKHVAGLSEKRAADIIALRNKNGLFYTRDELKSIKGIGEKIFRQCAGFLRVGPANQRQEDEFYKHKKVNKLDCTYIHPESYQLTDAIVRSFQLNLNDVGKADFIVKVNEQRQAANSASFAAKFDSSTETVELILNTLSKPLNFDMRSERAHGPLFKQNLTNIADLRQGSILTGSVCNVTHFGSFVDVGVSENGLIHSSKSKGYSLKIGDVVEVEVLNIEVERKRIGLRLIKVLD